MRRRSGYGWFELIIGIMLVVLGIFTFIRPESTLTGKMAIREAGTPKSPNVRRSRTVFLSEILNVSQDDMTINGKREGTTVFSQRRRPSSAADDILSLYSIMARVKNTVNMPLNNFPAKDFSIKVPRRCLIIIMTAGGQRCYIFSIIMGIV